MRGQDGLLLPGRRGEAGGDHEAALHSIGSVHSGDHNCTAALRLRNNVTVFPRK